MNKNYPEVAIGAVIFNTENKVLLLKSAKWNDRFILPCGHVEFGETLIDAVKREVKEETNLDVNNIKLIRVGELINSEEFHQSERHFVSLNFKCETQDKNVILNHEAEEFIWKNLDEALQLNIDSLTKASLLKLKNNSTDWKNI